MTFATLKNSPGSDERGGDDQPQVSFWEFVTRLESQERDGGVGSQEELSDQTPSTRPWRGGTCSCSVSGFAVAFLKFLLIPERGAARIHFVLDFTNSGLRTE